MAVSDRCQACGEVAVLFHDQGDVPANSCLLLDDRLAALRFQRGRLELVLCTTCGFIGNRSFEPTLAEYSARYEETQSFSPTFVDFAQTLARHWVDKYDLHGRSVLEIGCGKGEFLVMMCEAGAGHGIGIDPGAHPERVQSDAADRIEWITDFYSEDYAHLRADAVVCRHTLEHIQPVGDFMRMVRAAIGDRMDTVVLFELPDVRRVLDDVAFWDVYYEHCSYFSAGSLARLFRSTGFEVLDLALAYDDQYLLVEAKPTARSCVEETAEPFPVEEEPYDLCRSAFRFGERCASGIAAWRERVQQVAATGGRAVIWGAGSKGVAYLNALGDQGDGIGYAVDVNPYKHGIFMAGTGQQIVPPAFLQSYRPDLVIAMNPVYVDEISLELRSLGLSPEVVSA